MQTIDVTSFIATTSTLGIFKFLSLFVLILLNYMHYNKLDQLKNALKSANFFKQNVIFIVQYKLIHI